MSDAEIKAIGVMLASLRNVDENSVVVSLGAYAPTADTFNGSVSATVTAGGHSATSEAVDLANALRLARAKLAREAEARATKAEKGA